MTQNPGVTTIPSRTETEIFLVGLPGQTPQPQEWKVIKDRVGWIVVLTKEQRQEIRLNKSAILIQTPRGNRLKLYYAEHFPGKEEYYYDGGNEDLRISIPLYDNGMPSVGFYDPRKAAADLAYRDLVRQGKRLPK